MRADFALLCLLLAAGCSRERVFSARQSEPRAPLTDAGQWARHVNAVEPAPPAPEPAPERELHAAVMPDDVEDSDEPVAIGRLVYRVSFYVPASFRDHRVGVRAPAGELHVDVSANRLRARFIGPGWPVPEGSEVRLRSDLPGVYLFDARGGRSLGAGQLAAWFEGREAKKMQSVAGVLRDNAPPAAKPIPTGLLCALFAEWAHQEREGLAYRCDGGSLPPGFRVGPWSGELTAVVPMEIPRRELRADEAEPPKPIAARGGAVLLEPAAMARVPSSRVLPGSAPASLLVDNYTDTRAVLIAQGVAIAWIDSGQSLRIDGFNPGSYLIGAIRPLGILRMTPKLVRIPGELAIGRPRVAPPAKPAEPTAGKQPARVD